MIDWIIENKEWVFSGVGVALISGIIWMIKAKRVRSKTCASVKQHQRSGSNSTNIQAARDVKEVTVVSGMTYSEVREIAKDVFEANFYKLSDIAAQTAKERADKLLDSYLDKLSERNPSAIKSSNDPDMQYALFTAQKEFARIGDEDLGEMLVNLLVDRAAHNERSLMQIVLNESLSIVPKLTVNQMDTLSIIFILKYTKYLRMDNLMALHDYIDRRLVPFLSNLTEVPACYQHLEFTGCGAISIVSRKIEEIFRDNYPGIFCKGFTLEKIESIVDKQEVRDAILIPCLHDKDLWQVKAIDGEAIEKIAHTAGADRELIKKIQNMQMSHLMNTQEVKDCLLRIHPKIAELFKYWDNSYMKNMTLTSVGIAIAHANILRKTNEYFDLTIWIK